MASRHCSGDPLFCTCVLVLRVCASQYVRKPVVSQMVPSGAAPAHHMTANLWKKRVGQATSDQRGPGENPPPPNSHTGLPAEQNVNRPLDQIPNHETLRPLAIPPNQPLRNPHPRASHSPPHPRNRSRAKKKRPPASHAPGTLGDFPPTCSDAIAAPLDSASYLQPRHVVLSIARVTSLRDPARTRE